MICKVPYIENKFRQNNPDLADKLNQDYSTIYKLLKESHLFKELDNNLILSEDINLYSKQSNLIKSINNQLKAQVILEYNNKISINVLPLSIDSLNKNIIQEIVFTQKLTETEEMKEKNIESNTQYSDYLSQPELLTNLVIVDYQKENDVFSKYYTDELSYEEQSEWLEIYNLNIPDAAKYYILNNLTELPYNETAISEFVSQTDYDYNLPYQYRIKLLEVLLRDNPLNNNSIITTNKDFLKVFGIIRQDEEYKIEFKSYTNQKGISIPTVIVNGDEYTGFWNDEFDGIHFNPITMETKINNNEDFIKESIKYKGLKNMMSNKDYENYLKMNDSEKLNFLEILFNTQLNEQDVKNNNEHIIKHVLIEEENNITNLPTCI